ncbi:SLC13 family permease [Teredinibacter purpureus]|uniref:SLC13 family permease n=1 Tax=Teredinibacter purpureus TaxID=2731756 RepID=UPI0005F80549|nr:SLC13 family permease [Teredinibacter purpureus]
MENSHTATDAINFGEQGTRSSTSDISQFLVDHPIFSGCKKEDLARCMAHASTREVAAGETLYRQGAPANSLYFLQRGQVELTLEENTIPIDGFLGEESAIGMDTYIYTAIAKTETTVIEMSTDFIRLQIAHTHFKKSIIDLFHQRLSGKPAMAIARAETWQPTIKTSTLVGWLLTLVAPVALYYGLDSFRSDSSLTSNAITYAAILSTCGIMWVFRLLPDYITGLFSILSAVLMGISPAKTAFSGFSSDSFFLAMSILGLSVVIKTSGLSYRTLIKLLRIGPASKLWYNLSFFSIGTLLTPFIPTTNGRITIVSPFLAEMLSSASKKVRETEGPRLKASLLFGTSLLSPIFVSSKSINFVVLGMLPVQVQESFQWVNWLLASIVVGVVIAALYAIASWVIFRNPEKFVICKDVIAEQDKLLGPVNSAEWSGLLGLTVLLLGLMFSTIHKIDIAWVAMAIMFYLVMFGFLEQKQFRAAIDWSFLVFLGSLIGMVAVIRETHLDIWLMNQMGFLTGLMGSNMEVFILVLALSLAAVRVVLPINATVVIFATLLIPVSTNLTVNPWLIGFLILLFAESFYRPYQASYYLLFQELTKGVVPAGEQKMLLLNIVITLIKLIAVYASMPYWASMGLL